MCQGYLLDSTDKGEYTMLTPKNYRRGICGAICFMTILLHGCGMPVDTKSYTREPAVMTAIVSEPIAPQAPVAEIEIPTPQYSDQELEILALIIYQEAGGDACSDETRQMVGEVFLNRVRSSAYPDTFLEVATQRAQYGRLYWTGLAWPERASLSGEQRAVERAYRIAKNLLDKTIENILPEDAIFQAEFKQGDETLAHSDGLYFCRLTQNN